jgi:translation initiation factor 2 subunit 1
LLASEEVDWPEVGDLVLATVRSITNYGAYVTLDEYNKEGLLHISEISSTWIRNIRNFVREGQKVVLKVLRVNTKKGQVDLSFRRVSKREKREKLLAWKKARKAEGLLRSASEKLNIPIEEIYGKAGDIIEKKYGLYSGLQKTAREGVEVLLELGVPKEIALTLAEVAKEKIKLISVRVRGILDIQCMKPKGVNLIRGALLGAQKVEKPLGSEINVWVVSAPKYCIEVSAENYKEAEGLLKKAADAAIEKITEAGGTGSFERTK